MKPWSETIRFVRPPRELRLSPSDGAAGSEECRAKEAAAYERGRRDGEKHLSEQLVRQRAELLEIQNGVLESIRDLLPRLARECEAAMVTLAMEVARKLVDGLEVSPAAVEANIREAIQQIEEGTQFDVLLNPEDLRMLQKANSPLLLPESRLEQVRFVASEEVTRGGSMVRTRFGIIDARRESKFELLKNSLIA